MSGRNFVWSMYYLGWYFSFLRFVLVVNDLLRFLRIFRFLTWTVVSRAVGSVVGNWITGRFECFVV